MAQSHPSHDADLPDAPYDLGVLFVHGIGQSAQGETLIRFGEPLREAIEELAVPSASGASGGAQVSAQVSVSAAWAGDSRRDRPAHAELDIKDVAATPSRAIHSEVAARTSRWLLAEAWWAAKFPTPSYADIVSWSFGVLPATLIAHFDRRFRRAVFALVRAVGSSTSRAVMAALGRVAAECGGLLLAVAATPLVLLAICLLLLIGLLPFRATRAIAGSLQRKMAATVGDSYVFMHQQLTAATILTTVRERLEWLAARCRRVVVVAHSQGGAIAHRVLSGPVTAPCRTLITFGSGLAKLSDIQRGDSARGQGLLWWGTLGGALAAVAVVLFLARGWHLRPGMMGLVAGLVPSLLVAVCAALLLTVPLLRMTTRLIEEELRVRRAFRARTSASSAAGQASATPSPATLPPDSAPSAAPRRLRGWPAPFFAVLVGALIAALRMPWANGWGAAWPEAPLGTLLAFGMGLAYDALTAWHGVSERTLDPQGQWLRDRILYRDHFEFRNRPYMLWYDLYAPADPVPNGHLLDDFQPPGLYSIPVHNSHSMLLDHTTYWDARDDFVEQVTRVLLREAQIPIRNLDHPRAARRRAWRVRVLRAARTVLGIAALVLAVQWLADPPQALRAAVDSVLAPPNVAEASTPGWRAAVKPWVPLAVVALLWFSALFATLVCWRSWGKDEVRDYLGGTDYRPAPFGLWLTMVAPFVLGCFAAYATQGVIGALAFCVAALAAIVACAAVRTSPSGRVRSQSGPAAELKHLEIEQLNARYEAARKRLDREALTAIGERLGWLDYGQAVKALHRAAFGLTFANAAWALGRLHERVARATVDPAQKAQAWASAIEAYQQGGELGDPISARYAALALKEAGREAEAETWFRRAFDMGDARSASSVGMRLMKDRKRDEGRRIYEEGVERGDALSAAALAGHFEALAEASSGDDAIRLRRDATRMYRVAFELGDVTSATSAGDLLRRIGDIAAARRAYALGVRMNNAFAALRLGQLEQEVEEDPDAAYRAYRTAIRLDLHGGDAAEALLALGKLLEKLQRPQAAIARYREAFTTRNGREASVEAGVALVRLLRAERFRTRELALALRDLMVLKPAVGADAYVQHLADTLDPDDDGDVEDAVAMTDAQIAGLSAHGLVVLAQMLMRTDAAKARSLIERAQGYEADSAQAAGAP